MTVRKRAAPFTKQFESVELRIGSVDKTDSPPVQFAENPMAGYSAASSNVVEVIFDVNPPMIGRYLTLQTIADQYFAIDEVYAKRPTSTQPTGNNSRIEVRICEVTFMGGKSKFSLREFSLS